MGTASPTGWTPARIREAYGINNITFNGGTVVGDGSGTTIAIVNAYDSPNIASDLQNFNRQFGLPDTVFTKVDQYGGTNYPEPNSLWIQETALDVQWAHAIAPKANILLVVANSNRFSDLLQAVDYARNVPGVVAVSMSWGTGEFSNEVNFDKYFTTPAGHSGVTFVASSGDTGSPPQYPSVSPNVISTGGTALYVDSTGKWVNEMGVSFSGGGISTIQPKPAYQNHVLTPSSAYRTSPDVAFAASGFAIYDSYNNGVDSPWSNVSGTSACSPQWAGLIAIANQGRILAGKPTLDGATQTLPALYSMPAASFRDIVTGTSVGTPNLTATSGYDLVTGRGTPVVGSLISQLVSYGAPAANVRVITATANGKTTFSLTYSIQNAAVSGPLNVGIYRSSDAIFGGDTLLSTVTISSPADLTIGTHTKTFTIGGGVGQIALPGAGSAEVDQDYFLLAVADPNKLVSTPVNSNNVARFSGVYHTTSGRIYVQGTAGADNVTVFGYTSVTLNGTTSSYSLADVSGVVIRTHEGDDVVDASTSAYALNVFGGGGNDTIKGGNGANRISGGLGINVLSSGNGNNTFLITPRTVVGADRDTVTTGLGTNTLSLATFTSGVTFSLQAAGAQTIDTATRFQLDVSKARISTVQLGSGNDTVTGNATLGTYISGGGGNNVLTGGAGNDTLVGGTGNNTLTGMGGNDTYVLTQRTVAGSTQDTIVANTTGSNTLSFTSFTHGLTLNLQNAGSQLVDPLMGYRIDVSRGLYKTVLLGAGNDVVTGNATVGTYISGGNGNNAITGGSGNDTLVGGTGSSTFTGLGGSDTFVLAPRVFAGSTVDTIVSNSTGFNTLSFSSFVNPLTVNLQTSGTQTVDPLTGYKINLVPGQIRFVILGSGNDFVTGNAVVPTTLQGGAGNNILIGGSGKDSLSVTGVGRNILIGGGGTDTLQGSGGDDILIAGAFSYSTNAAAMLAIQRQWVSTDTYSVRIANLKGPSSTGLRLNGSYYLTSQTIAVDPSLASILGGLGNDWFWSNPLNAIDRVLVGSITEVLN